MYIFNSGNTTQKDLKTTNNRKLIRRTYYWFPDQYEKWYIFLPVKQIYTCLSNDFFFKQKKTKDFQYACLEVLCAWFYILHQNIFYI